MSDLATFLRARLDEDEAVAKAAEPHVRYVASCTPTLAGVAEQVAVEDHQARHDPARVLREVEAARKILDQLGTDLSYRPPVPPGHQRAWAIASLIVEAMAAVYSDHPDYDEAWKS